MKRLYSFMNMRPYKNINSKIVRINSSEIPSKLLRKPGLKRRVSGLESAITHPNFL